MIEMHKEMAELMDLAKLNLMRHGRVELFAFIHSAANPNSVAILPMEQLPDKVQAQAVLRQLIRQTKALRTLVVAEALYKTGKEGDKIPVSLAEDKDAKESITIFGYELGEITVMIQEFRRILEQGIGECNFFPKEYKGVMANA